ncbi:MAG: hypothetical protein HY365_01195 [Candidatus Aenigmarchaeota archaeon]|nr:hypothetical protein [Candidatus Aenigmarchaeota archaeon]
MKGSSLPMDSVVMLILAVLVLGALVFFFFGTFTPGADAIKAQQTIASVCGELSQYKDCSLVAFKSGKNIAAGDDETFKTAQGEKLKELNIACATTKAATCAGSGEAGQSCINICCQTYCPSTTTTTTK